MGKSPVTRLEEKSTPTLLSRYVLISQLSQFLSDNMQLRGIPHFKIT